MKCVKKNAQLKWLLFHFIANKIIMKSLARTIFAWFVYYYWGCVLHGTSHYSQCRCYGFFDDYDYLPWISNLNHYDQLVIHLTAANYPNDLYCVNDVIDVHNDGEDDAFDSIWCLVAGCFKKRTKKTHTNIMVENQIKFTLIEMHLLWQNLVSK